MERDVREYVTTCKICARSKSSTSRAAELLQPLATPHHPWSHITSPASHHLTVRLSFTILDRFSKAAQLRKLPFASEITKVLVDYVFRLHGNPIKK